MDLYAAPLYYLSGQVVANAYPDDLGNTPSTTTELEAVSHADAMSASSNAGNQGLARYEADHAKPSVRAEVYAENAFVTSDIYHWANAGGNSQLDTDGDGYGNNYDPDFDNNLGIDFADLAFLKSVFFSSDADADLNGYSAVDFADLAILKAMFFGAPGPSGLVP
jgi:hypothetical protein